VRNVLNSKLRAVTVTNANPKKAKPLLGPETDGRLAGVLQLLNTENVVIKGVVDDFQVFKGGSLSDSTKLIIDTSVANANPSLVVTEVRNRNATQVSANGRADQHLRVLVVIEEDSFVFIEQCLFRQSMLLFDFLVSETSDEDRLSVPHNLNDFARRQGTDVNLKISVAIVSLPAGHSVDYSESEQTSQRGHGSPAKSIKQIDLGSTNINVLFVVHAIFIKPVVDIHLEIDVVAEIARSGRSCEELGSRGNLVSAIQLLLDALLIIVCKSE